MGSKLMYLLCLLSCLFANSLCQESSSVIREVTDVGRVGVLNTMRTHPPSSYLMKMNSFSLVAKAENKDRFESAVFETGGYKWRLVVSPNGNKNASGAGYISLYLAIQDSNFLSNNWEVYADIKFFVYNQAEDKFLTIQDGLLKRFQVVSPEWGFAQVLPLATFNDAKKGYLVNDYCAFGTEVYVTQPTKNWEGFNSIKPNTDEITFKWKIINFSKLDKEFYYSDDFTAAGIVWKMKFYPIGTGAGEGKWLSLFLLAYGYQNNKPRNETVYASYKLRVLNQKGGTNVQREHTVGFLPPSYGWGTPQFISLADLQNPSKGFLVSDALIAQAEILQVSETKYYP